MRETEPGLVSVIVPTLGRKTLRPLLEGLASQRAPFPFEVVLVPQGPLAPGLPLAENVRLAPADAGRGFAHVRNVGLSAARGDPVVFIDDDAKPAPDWLDRITAPVRTGDAAAASADLRVALGRGALADAISRLGFPGGAAAGWRAMWGVDEDGSTRHLCTGNCALARSALVSVGTFDESLIDGSEDVDLGDRIVADGLRIAYVEGAFVEHEARTGLGRFLVWNLRRGRSAWDLSRRARVGGHVKGRVRSSLRILRRHAFTRHGPAVLGVMALQYVFQTLGYLQAKVGHRPGVRRGRPAAPETRPGPTPFVTVVVATRDREDDLARCLGGVGAQTYPRFEVLVVDNGSTDATPAVLAAAAALDGRIRGVREATPGVSHARNLGIEKARGEILAFLDDDAVPPPNWLRRLVGALRDPGIGCAGGPTRSLWDEPPPHLVARSVRARSYVGEFDRGRRARDVPWVAGGNCAYRREALTPHGLFRTDAGVVGSSRRGGEDLEMCLRVGRTHRVRYEPSAWVHHRVPSRKVAWRHLFRVAFSIGRGRGEDARGGEGSASSALGLLDLVLAGVAAAGWVRGRLDRRRPAPVTPMRPSPSGPIAAEDPAPGIAATVPPPSHER